MSDNIRIDSHKLIFHPNRVSEWMKGENIYPIELEIGLTNACNHRCTFCALEYTGYQPVTIEKDIIVNNLKDLSSKGLKSVIYAGEGEPLIHKNAGDIINATKSFGIDAALSTNGVLLNSDFAENCLKSLTWVRFSVAGIKEETYKNIHQCKAGDLQKVLINMQNAVEVKKKQKLSTTLGVQLLLLPENQEEVVQMAKELKKIGVDYFTIKPFSKHPQSNHNVEIDYRELSELEQQLKEEETSQYKIYYRAHAMEKICQKRSYKQCLALPFMVYIDARGNLWPCIVFMGKQEFSYGNLYKNSFIEIWEGDKRKELIEYFNQMDLEKNCRQLCRLDEMNQYLNQLKHPQGHVNFI